MELGVVSARLNAASRIRLDTPIYINKVGKSFKSLDFF